MTGFTKHDEGTYGTVYLNVETNEIQKELPKYYRLKGGIGPGDYIEITSIVDLVTQASFGDLIPGIPTLKSVDMTDFKITLTMDYLGDNLYKHPDRRKNALVIMHQLTKICLSLYEYGVQHTDIKPSNILVSNTGAGVHLIDFNLMSFANTLVEGKWSKSYGTWCYCAPEIVRHKTPSNTSMVWSLAMIMAFCFAKFPLPNGIFNTKYDISSRRRWIDVFELLQQVDPDNYPLFENYAKDIPCELHAVFKHATAWDPSKRMTIYEMHHFFAQQVPIEPKRLPQTVELDTDVDITIACKKLNILHLQAWANNIYIKVRDHFLSSQYEPKEVKGACVLVCMYLSGLYVYDDDKRSYIMQRAFGVERNLNDILFEIGNYLEWKLIHYKL